MHFKIWNGWCYKNRQKNSPEIKMKVLLLLNLLIIEYFFYTNSQIYKQKKYLKIVARTCSNIILNHLNNVSNIMITWLQTQHLFGKTKTLHFFFCQKKYSSFIWKKIREREERTRNSNSKGHSIRIEKWIIDTYLLTLFSLERKKRQTKLVAHKREDPFVECNDASMNKLNELIGYTKH